MTDKQKLALIDELVSEAFEGVSDKEEQSVGFLLGLFSAVFRIIQMGEEND